MCLSERLRFFHGNMSLGLGLGQVSVPTLPSEPAAWFWVRRTRGIGSSRALRWKPEDCNREKQASWASKGILDSGREKVYVRRQIGASA